MYKLILFKALFRIVYLISFNTICFFVVFARSNDSATNIENRSEYLFRVNSDVMFFMYEYHATDISERLKDNNNNVSNAKYNTVINTLRLGYGINKQFNLEVFLPFQANTDLTVSNGLSLKGSSAREPGIRLLGQLNYKLYYAISFSPGNDSAALDNAYRGSTLTEILLGYNLAQGHEQRGFRHGPQLLLANETAYRKKHGNQSFAELASQQSYSLSYFFEKDIGQAIIGGSINYTRFSAISSVQKPINVKLDYSEGSATHWDRSIDC
ncbi:MAG: hypothetical protein NZ480_09185 [Bdellovibrionaceae bacterium]|nr:hypothetical protein [Pseudobdellovibrionaceae bacterium]MDW8189431.1 hypothetical protein [Pseudobdellovibrionaceae bacterium]